MFKHKAQRQALNALDWTQVLAEDDIVSPSMLADLGIVGDVQCLAWDAVQHLLALGTKAGHLYLMGRAGVYTKWQLHGSSNVKHLAFKAGAPVLCVIDGRDTLHAFDFSELDAEQRPKRLFAWSARSAVTCIEVSPAHSHLILGLRDGTVDFYDLDRGHPSPYRIANLWLPQEELLRRSGVLNAPSRRHIPMCIDIKQHPLDLNRLFIAYEGGVVLFNLRDRQPERTYELVIPPGATGGGNDVDTLTERRPALTCITVRPDGLLLVAGSEDGCICFWSIEEGDIPLSVRTIDRDDVNRISSDSVFGMSGDIDAVGLPVQGLREPIFRLAWSGFPEEGIYDKVASYTQSQHVERANGTMLSILGGLLPSDIRGVHVLHFPPMAVGQAGEPPQLTMAKSLMHVGHSVYDTPLPPEDFLLLSRSPHYCGAYDPFAIITVQSPFSADGSASNKRFMHSWNFPPSLTAVPELATLPAAAHCAVSPLQFEVLSTSSLNLQRLLHASSVHLPPRIPVDGGYASGRTPTASRPDVGRKTEVRLLLSLLPGLKIQLGDISTPLLAGTADGSLVDDFALPLFDIDIAKLLTDPRCDRLMAHRILKETPELLTITRIAFTCETSEVVIALSTGEVVIGRIESSRALPLPHDDQHVGDDPVEPGFFSAEVVQPAFSPPTSPPLPGSEKAHRSVSKRLFRSSTKSRSRSDSTSTMTSRPSSHLSLVDLDGAAFDGLHLICGIAGMPMPPTCLCACDVGFVAIAWPSRLVVLDLRGPDVVIDDQLDRGLGDIRAMAFMVSPFDAESEMAPRLIVSHESGTTRIHTLRHSLETWVSAGPPLTFEHESLGQPMIARMLSPRGEAYLADADALQDALRGYQPHQTLTGVAASFLLLVSVKSACVVGRLADGRLSKADFEEPIIAAQVVRRHDACMLAVMDQHAAIDLLSLPSLQVVHHIHPLMHFEPGADLCARIAPDGDFAVIDRNGTGEMHLGTLFGRARAVLPPQLSLYDASLRAPYRPTFGVMASLQGGMAGFAQWMRGPATLTGDTFDALIAGPNRPAKKEPVVRAATASRAARSPPLREQRESAAQSSSNTYESWSQWASNLTTAKQESSSAHRSAAETNEMLRERDDHLSRLNESFANLGKGASDMFKEAKKSAADQAIKAKLGSLFS